MTTFSQARGLQVVSTSTAATVGKVDGLLVDPVSRRVVALTLKKSAGGDVLRWSDLTAFGTDAVTVSGEDRLGSADEQLSRLGDKHHHPLGKRVLSADGDELGKLSDVEFDPGSGEVTGLVLDTGPIAGARLLGIGTYAVVVTAG